MRHPSLISLSHDHHYGLALALRCRKQALGQLKPMGPAGLHERARELFDFFAGNLIAHMPEARAVALNSLRAESPPADQLPVRPCVAIWRGSLDGSSTRPELPPQPEWVAALAGTGAGRIDDIFVDWPQPLYGEDRQSVWRVTPLPEDSSACRTARGL